MKFEPKSEEEVKTSFPVWAGGMYDFEVIGGTDTKAKSSGAEMIKLRLKVFNSEGEEINVWDNLMESVAWKLRNACECMGLMDKYNAGDLCGTDFDGCTGRLKLRRKPAEGEYGEKNEVADYFVAAAGSTKPEPKKAKSPSEKLDDSIPF